MYWIAPLVGALSFGSTLSFEPAPTWQGRAGQEEMAQEKPATMAESVEVMRRLVVKSIRASRGTTGTASTGAGTRVFSNHLLDSALPTTGVFAQPEYFLTGTSGSVTMGHSADNARGYHLPGTGAIFSVDVVVPSKVVVPETTATAGDRADEVEDEWEEIRSEVRQGVVKEDTADAMDPWELTHAASLAWASPTSIEVVLNPTAVEAVVDSVLDALAKHGRRLPLAMDESITVAMTITGHDLGPWGLTPMSYLELGGTQSEQANWLAVAHLAAFGENSKAKARRVVVRVPRHALTSGLSGAKDLRGHAQIHQY